MTLPELEGLVIGPTDRLLIKLPEDTPLDDGMLDALLEEFRQIGLEDRVLVIVGEFEFVKFEED